MAEALVDTWFFETLRPDPSQRRRIYQQLDSTTTVAAMTAMEASSSDVDSDDPNSWGSS